MGLRDRHLFRDYSCFFITTSCYRHLNLLHGHEYKLILADSINHLNKKYKSELLSYVLMSNHLHLILYFKHGNHLSDYMRDFKKFTAFKIRKKIEEEGNLNLLNSLRINHPREGFKVWMDRFDDVYLESQKILETKLDYIHYNPVEKDICKDPVEYLYSSAHYYYDGTRNDFPIQVIHYKEYF